MGSITGRAWTEWSPAERRTSVGLALVALFVMAFLLRDPAVQSFSGGAKALAVASFCIGSILSPSFFLTSFQELKVPPRPMRVGLLAFIALFSLGAAIELFRSILGSV